MSRRLILNLFLCLLLTTVAAAKTRLAAKDLEGVVTEDLPAPFNLQAVVVNKTVTLSWDWNPPDPGPNFTSFGYEVFRDSSVVLIVPKTSATDFSAPIGQHTYKVRVKGGSVENKKKIAHVSGWSEPVNAETKLTCGGLPVVQLNVQPTKRVYGAIPALRLHFTGQITVPEGCTLSQPMFHIDSGVSAERNGPVALDAKGRFDEFIDAMDPDAEAITGSARFSITVSAKDEAGGSVSNPFVIELERENKFAPKSY
jgi:hypothetical protein